MTTTPKVGETYHAVADATRRYRVLSVHGSVVKLARIDTEDRDTGGRYTLPASQLREATR